MKTVKLAAVILLLVSCLFITGLTDVQAEVIAYDADGQFLGILIGFQTMGTNFSGLVDVVADVHLPSIGKNLRISMKNGDVAESELSFTDDNCPLDMAYADSTANFTIIKNGDTYYEGEEIAPIEIRRESWSGRDGSGCNSYGSFRMYAIRVHEYDISKLPFALPVALPLSFEYKPAHPGKWKKKRLHNK